MTKTLTTEQLQGIYEAAVHVEATLNDPDAEFELYCKLDEIGGVEATIRKLIDMMRAANREAQPLGYIDPGNLKTYRGVMAGGSWSPVKRTLSGLNLTLPIYLSAPPATAVPDFGALTKLIVGRLIDCGAAGDDSIADAETFVYNACRAAMLAQPVSQDYKLVPVEPTQAMRDAWFFMENFDTEWKAMLAAAPEGGNAKN